jgi:hypothetical protein
LAAKGFVCDWSDSGCIDSDADADADDDGIDDNSDDFNVAEDTQQQLH